jgi:xanthine dehydrogenase small subunit
MTAIRFSLNGREVVEAHASPTTTLLDYLRRHLQLTGTKEGCAEGDCGACTVAMIDADAPGGAKVRAINSCLVPLPMVHGLRLFTVEGLDKGGAPHPVQQALVEELGSQCGYCTPGVAMSLVEACYRRDLDAEWKLDDQLCGNLCRCTGYRPIRACGQRVAGLRPRDEISAELARPNPGRALQFEAQGQRFFQPDNWSALFEVFSAHPEYRIVQGASDLGLDITKKRVRFPTLVSLSALPDFRAIHIKESEILISGGALLADVEDATDRTLPMLAKMLRFFGSRQIKNRATVGGNLCNASPIGDLAPALLALDAEVVLRSAEGDRVLPLVQFFLGYRQTALRPGEVLAMVKVPLPSHTARLNSYKVSKRREMDISAVAAGIYVDVDTSGITHTARIAYGGMAATPARARRAEDTLLGRPFDEPAIEAAAAALEQDFSPLSDHRGSAWFRMTLAKNLLRGFFEETRENLAPRLADRPTGTVGLEVVQ